MLLEEELYILRFVNFVFKTHKTISSLNLIGSILQRLQAIDWKKGSYIFKYDY